MERKRASRRITKSNRRSRTMILSNIFPHDIMIDICSRLPVKSLLKFKCVSKSWHDMVTDRLFAKLHLHQFNSNFKGKLMLFRNGSLYSLDYQNSDEFRRVQLPRLETCSGVLASCNGLLLCSAVKQTPLYIWNPCIAVYQKLICPDRGFIAVGFGYNSNVNEYEVVMRNKPWCDKSDTRAATSEKMTYVYVYSLYKNSWREILNNPYFMDSVLGVFVNGSLHWRTSTTTGESWKLITAFSIGGERFTEVLLPASIVTSKCLDFKIINYQGNLGVACGEFSLNNFELWVMKDYKVRESWAKLFTVEFARPRNSLFTKDGLILMLGYQDDHSSLFMYDPKNGSTRKIGGAQGHDFLWVQSYADSLVQVHINYLK